MSHLTYLTFEHYFKFLKLDVHMMNQLMAGSGQPTCGNMRHPSHDAQTLLPLVYRSQPQAKYFPVWPPHSVSKYIVFRLRYSLYLKVQFFFRSLTLRKHLQSQMSIIKILNMMNVLEKSSGYDSQTEEWKNENIAFHYLCTS